MIILVFLTVNERKGYNRNPRFPVSVHWDKGKKLLCDCAEIWEGDGVSESFTLTQASLSLPVGFLCPLHLPKFCSPCINWRCVMMR